METSSDDTLRLINRNHSWEDVVSAVERLHSADMEVGVHLIAGLPGETAAGTLQTVHDVCALPISSMKMHQLQVIKGSMLHKMIDRGEMVLPSYSLDEYVELCKRIIAIVPRHIAIERFLASAPPDMVVSPKWGIKNFEFTNRLIKELNDEEKKNINGV